jgi:predicted type IV restriction endonuclease
LLDNPEFGEDAVREELVAPLLRALGYSASPPYQIIRSRKLEHPFAYFGTVKKDITIIPDYVLERDGRPAWILDAKAPRVAIDTGKNVERAYSYAMHRDVRALFYALCNGAASRYGTCCTTSR